METEPELSEEAINRFVVRWLSEHEPHIALKVQVALFTSWGWNCPTIYDPPPDPPPHLVCETCGRVVRSVGGLAMHRQRKHAAADQVASR